MIYKEPQFFSSFPFPDRKPPMKQSFNFFAIFVVGFIGIIFLFIVASLASALGFGSRSIQENAERYAKHYARTFHNMENPRAICAGVDTDGNTYVTCTITNAENTGTEQIECPANIWLEPNTSCRVRQAITIVSQDNQ